MPGSIAVVDVMTLTLQPQGGASVKFEDVVSFEITATQESRPVFTMRADRTPRAFRHGARNVSGQFEVVVPLGGLAIDLEDAQRRKIPMEGITERGIGGVQKTIVDMLITEVSEGSTGEGEHTFRCNFVCADYRSNAPGLGI